MEPYNRIFMCTLFLLTAEMLVLAQSNPLQSGIEALENSKYNEALDYLERANRELKDVSIEDYLLSKTLTGHCLIKINKWDQGIGLLQRNILEAERLSDQPDYWRVQNQYYIADAQFNLGKYDLAEETVKANIAAVSEQQYPMLLARNYNLLGIILWEEGNSNLALEYLEKSILINEELETAELGTAYNDLGLIYQDIDFNTSLNYYQMALDHYQQYYPEIHAKNALLLSNLGLVHFDNGALDLAQNYFQESKAIWEAIYPNQNHASKAYMLNNLGRVAQERGEYEASLQYFQEALAMYQELYGVRHPEIANTWNLIATSHLKNGNFEDGLISVQDALIANSEGFESIIVEENPPVSDYISWKTFLSSLLNKSKLLRQQYVAKTIRIRDLQNAMAALETADSVLNVVRQSASSKKDKLLLGTISSQIYQEAVSLCYFLSVETQQSHKYYARAFYFSEKAKGIVLLESINDSKIKAFSGIPDSLLQQEKDIRREISFLEQQMALRPAAGATDAKERLFELNRTYEALQQNLESNYANYFNLKYSIRPVALSALQSTLNPETVVLEYMITEREVYVFTISRKKVALTSLAKNDRLDALINGLRNTVRFQVKEYYVDLAHQLYKELFPSKLKNSFEHVVVVQDGRLTALPMESLLAKKVNYQKKNYTELPYLVREYAFSYAYSATLWYQNSLKVKNENKEIALLAPVEFQRQANLPATEKEANEIARVSTQNDYAVNIFLRAQANEEEIKSGKLEDYAIIHLATHGRVDEVNPDLSYVSLGRKGSEDGDLFAGEVYNLQLNADLVTLSACEVGLGKYSKGEGVIGLGRAFMYAGANNLILSLWKVSDEATSQLMIDFYTTAYTNQKSGYHAALRQAKLGLISQEKLAAPYYWSAFFLVGN